MSTAIQPPPDPHRAMMAARKNSSALWRVIHFLGSLKLALTLLATIAIACAIATFCESRFDTKIAHAYIYKAPWFLVWLGVLCINLFAVTITRWPWQRRHLGFVITHYGIIILLVGAVLGSQFGFEGNVTLHKGEKPTGRITTNRTVIQLQNLSTGEVFLGSFDPSIARPSERRPVELAVPDSFLKLVADGYTSNLVAREQLTASDAPEAVPGASLDFSTAMMGQRLTLSFLENTDRDFFGRARVVMLPALPRRESGIARETQMVFAKFAPIVQTQNGSTGVTVHLGADGETLTITAPNLAPQTRRRADAIGKPLRIGSATVEIDKYWPDLKIENGQPATASAQPNNPAILVHITGPSHTDAAGRAKPLLEFAPGKDGLHYQLSRAGKVYASGSARAGETFPLGWADWQAAVVEILPKAAIAKSFEPGPENVDGSPGFCARLRAPDGKEGPSRWIPSGEFTTLELGNTALRVGFGQELRPVPFTIALKNFEVPRVEGTDTPKNFIATVEFTDLKTGATRQAIAQMNHPASWPGTAFAVTTGLNYKFSQAQWDPKDLGQTTLQVLYDPGWLFKWMGSLAICTGIFIMFYLRPKKS